jgi:CHAT domain-containing protein
VLGLASAAAVRAPSAAAETLEEQVRAAEAQLDELRDGLRRDGVLPGPQDVVTSESALKAAADAYTPRRDWPRAAGALLLLDRAERMVSRWEPAIVYAEQAAQAARRGHDGARQARALMDRADAELGNNVLGPAELHAEAAVGLAARAGDPTLKFDTLDVLASADTTLGRTNAAAEMLARAFLIRGVKDDSLVRGLLHRGEVYWRIARRCEQEPLWDVCLQALDRSRDEYRQAGDLAHRRGWLGLEAAAQGFVKDCDDRAASIKFQQGEAAKDLADDMFHPKQASDVLLEDHFVLLDTKPPPGVEESYLESKGFQAKVGGFARSSSAGSLYDDGLLRRWHGDHPGALGYFQKAIDVLEQDQRLLADDTARAAYFAEYFDIYAAATLELLEMRRLAEAFAMMERARGRAMAYLLAGRRLDVGGAAEQRLYAQGRRLDSELGARQAALFALEGGGGSPAQIQAGKAQVAGLEKARRALAARTVAEAPRLAALTSPQPIALQALQALARDEHVEVIEYLVTGTSVVVWYVAASAVEVRSVFLPRGPLKAALDGLQNDLASPDRPFDHTRARELYLQLIQPVRSFVTGDRLLIVPHDVLSGLPFEVLEDPADGVPLGARFQIAYAPSATLYAGLRRWSAGAGKKALVIADPNLEADGKEAERVAGAYRGAGGTKSRLELALPSKRHLVRAISGFDVVHLSVHGTFDGAEPLLSYLKLARDGRDDGRLTAAEMFGLPLARTSLIVLSACESGRLEATPGNDLVGMVRGLVYAGAGALVLSRWAVRAAPTALWMETFHRQAQTDGLAAAARQAREAVRADPRWAHPFYWAAFSLVGRAR